MAVSCPEVMYGAYYPYLYGRAGPSRPFYQYERFNQDLYSSSGVPLAASSSTSAGSHSPCSPLLPPSLPSNMAAAQSSSTLSSSVLNASALNASALNASALNASALNSSVLNSSATIGSVNQTAIPTIPLGALQRHITKEEDISTVRSDTEGTISGAHNDSSCSSGPDSPHNLNLRTDAGGLAAVAAAAAAVSGGGSGESSGGGGSGGGGGGGAGASGGAGSSSGMAMAGGSGTGRAQYLSATCVVFTNYSGDAASSVDEHFSRALNFSDKNNKGYSSSMTSRNFPPSFWNSNYVHPTPAPTHHHQQVSDLYSTDSGYSADPWHAAHYGSYAHAAHAHAAHAHAYHHNMAQYGSLLRLPQQYGHTSSSHHRLHHDQQTAHALESAAAYTSYPTMAGLEAQVQESSKDLYWF
ncbi:protein vestigial-like isoform X1 [Anopheles albimanus]|uniref:protein vestigial-like isoform X1 n=1 Tax=Anopheles albimanus TaxID=7167 RepID=UPI00163ED462|nr:protein vestigial-like isoform X1 [Anopheles albimanus]